VNSLKPLINTLWEARSDHAEGAKRLAALRRRSRRPCLVANRATLPQKWSPPHRNVADSCDLTATNKPTQPSISRGRVVSADGSDSREEGSDHAEGAKLLPSLRPVCPYSGRDGVESLRSSYTRLYPPKVTLVILYGVVSPEEGSDHAEGAERIPSWGLATLRLALCQVTSVILHGVVSPEIHSGTRGYILR